MDHKMTDSEAATIKARWDKLQGQGYSLDFERAKLLHTIWAERYDRDDKTLGAFLVAIIGEYPGKRCARLIRLVNAFDRNNNVETWRQIGGQPIVLLVRLAGREQRQVMVKVRQTLRSTGRAVLHTETFRTIVRSVVGDARYRTLLVEPKSRTNLRQRNEALQKELTAFKQYVLSETKINPSMRRRMPLAVRRGLGIDLAVG